LPLKIKKGCNFVKLVGMTDNGFAFASLATVFGGTTNGKVDIEAKRPANEANAHVGRSPGQISSSRSFICESVGAAKKDTGV